jgi:hypothetical protein
MQVLVVSFCTRWNHHFATELELLQQHLDAGDEIAVLACNADVPACMGNVKLEPAKCRECITHRYLGLKRLSSFPNLYSLGAFYTAEDRQGEALLKTTFSSMDEVRDYYFDNLDIGYAALSSTVGKCRDPYVESPENRAILGTMIRSSYRAYCSVKNFLHRHPGFDRVYIFNGRFATCRGAFRACQKLGVNVFLHERGSDNTRYALYENSLPHDRVETVERINASWDSASEDYRSTAREFYEKRRHRVESNWYSFTKHQEKNKLPEHWNEGERNIVVFTSSEDEFVAIGKEWENPYFESQTSAIIDLGKAIAERPSENVRIYVRMHPNLRGVDNRDTRQLRSLRIPGMRIVPPESEVCSYTMLDRAEKIISFGSTMGIEAVYWKKPSILCGLTFYRELGGTYNAESLEELVELTLGKLDPKPVEPALRYGLHATKFGEPFKHYQAHDFFQGEFRGRELRLPIPYAPYRVAVPSISRWYGDRPALRNVIEAVAYGVAYLPFVAAYDLLRSLRNTLRSTFRQFHRTSA